MNINKKRYIISLSVIVIGLIALISGTSYAILSGSSQSTHEQIIRAGSVELRLTENYENIDKGMYALPDEDGLLQEEFYEFTISNIGSTSAKYDLKLLNNETEANKLSDEYIKVGLEVNGKEMGPMSLNKVGNVIDSEVINKSEVIRYKLRLWLDVSKEDELVGLSDKDALLNLKVDAKQSEEKQYTFKVGDYISMTPDKTTYTIPASETGYTSDQTINPSELNLWRVISINSDGTFDAVSEYTSSTDVYFKGTRGYANYVGALQKIAAQYAKEGVTESTRMMGYDGQTLTISDTSAFDGTSNTAPSETSTPTPTEGTGQEYGGGVLGDTLYLKDYQLVSNVYKQDNNSTNYCDTGVCAYEVGTTTKKSYWLSSRFYDYTSSTDYKFRARYIYYDETVEFGGFLAHLSLRGYNLIGWADVTENCALRPIITLKANIKGVGGSGTKESPYTLENVIRIKVGDYISMTPDKATYTIPASETGYDSDQTINPSELNLWRVININNDGTFDAVSEYTSSTDVYFKGTRGYANYVGALQTIAAQYAKEGVTESTRMMGYDGQTLTLSDTSAFDGTTNTAPSTTSTPTPTEGTGQEYGGGVLGDTLYLKDYQLVSNVYKQDNNTTNYCSNGLCAYRIGTNTKPNYFLASRYYDYYSNDNGTITGSFFEIRYAYSSIGKQILRHYTSVWDEGSLSAALRPIIILKADIKRFGGSGTKESPYTLKQS